MSGLPVALQLYTLRDSIGDDFAGILEEVADLGYQGVEFAGYGDLGAGELKTILTDLGLDPVGSHVGLDQLESELNRAIDFNLTLGNEYLGCPFLPEDRRNDADGYRRVAGVLNRIGEDCRRQGLKFYYHNHAFEFEKFDGTTGLDILIGETEADLVGFELDLYWVQYAGVDPADYIKQNADRMLLIHLKDMKVDGDQRTFAEVGEGVLDWPEIFQACEATPAEWYIVEQDVCERPPLESVKLSVENLKEMGIL